LIILILTKGTHYTIYIFNSYCCTK